jgi:DNA-binding response OmpR family regulator
MWKLLVIDDEQERTEQVADWFNATGFEVIRAHSGKEGLQKAKDAQPNVILLDIVMPEMDGHDVLLRLKRDQALAKIPVVIYSYKAEELDGLRDLLRTGLREGADYIVAKKWGFAALEEVIQKLLRPTEHQRQIRAGCHELRLGDRCIEVWVDNKPIRLTRYEAGVLAHLNEKRGQPCSVRDIADKVWQDKVTLGDEMRVRRIIERLRDKIELDRRTPAFIVTVKGFGYKLTEGD